MVETGRLPAPHIATKRIVAAADDGKAAAIFGGDGRICGSTLATVARRTMRDIHNESCAVAATAELIGSKWTSVIVHDLSEGLQMLEHAEIVIRRSYPESPPRVEYELTPKGRALLPIVSAMRRFGRSWLVEAPRAGGLVAAAGR